MRCRMSWTSPAYWPQVFREATGLSCGARWRSVSRHFSTRVYLPVRPIACARAITTSWQVVASVTPQTTLWTPSTQTLSSMLGHVREGQMCCVGPVIPKGSGGTGQLQRLWFLHFYCWWRVDKPGEMAIMGSGRSVQRVAQLLYYSNVSVISASQLHGLGCSTFCYIKWSYLNIANRTQLTTAYPK